METLTIVLLSINILVAIMLTGVVLLQKSEGGALGMGGGPSNFMSARGTGDLLTRITWILFAVFLTISITLTLASAAVRKPELGGGLKVDPNDIVRPQAPAQQGDPSKALPPGIDLGPTGPAPATTPGSSVDLLAPSAPAPAAPEKK